MSFFVDIVTEDSFYENLTLGIMKVLEDSPCVKNVRIERRNGCDSGVIVNWEQRHCCVLPEDIRNFYISIDGFLLQWNLEIAGIISMFHWSFLFTSQHVSNISIVSFSLSHIFSLCIMVQNNNIFILFLHMLHYITCFFRF